MVVVQFFVIDLEILWNQVVCCVGVFEVVVVCLVVDVVDEVGGLEWDLDYLYCLYCYVDYVEQCEVDQQYQGWILIWVVVVEFVFDLVVWGVVVVLFYVLFVVVGVVVQ